MTGRLRLRLPSGQRKTPTRACKTGTDPLSQGREKWVTSKEGILTTIMARTDPSSNLNTATSTEITTNYSALINWIRQALFLTLLTGSFLKLNFAYNLFIPEGLPSDHAEALSFFPPLMIDPDCNLITDLDARVLMIFAPFTHLDLNFCVTVEN
jgi:hypothetical protein